MGKLIVLAVVIAAAYWYWQGPYQGADRTGVSAQLEENARVMKRCMRQERSITAGAGMMGADSGSGDAESLCAQKHGLEFREGQWHSLRTD